MKYVCPFILQFFLDFFFLLWFQKYDVFLMVVYIFFILPDVYFVSLIFWRKYRGHDRRMRKRSREAARVPGADWAQTVTI